METRNIVVLAFENAQLLDIAGPAQTFATAAELADDRAAPPYRIAVTSQHGGTVTTTSGIGVASKPFAEASAQPIDTLVVSGGPGVRAAAEEPRVTAWLTEQADMARRVCSVCTGAFLLAATGFLSGRRAVTHWRACAALKTGYPDIEVETDPIFVRDGKIWTSAGVTAGIDLALALVQEDLGHDHALRTAQRLVMFVKRPGGQSQFSTLLSAQCTDDGTFGRLHAWIASNLGADLRIERLADQAGMSVRNFARLYRARMGSTPAKAVEAMRIEAARQLLEQTVQPVTRIAERCGFGDEERMRRAFLRTLGVAPSGYRARFAANPGEAPHRLRDITAS